MAQRLDIASFRRELDHFQQRITGLQNPDGDTPVQILESSLLELELAKEELYVCTEELQRQAEELVSARAHPLTGAFTSQHAPFVLLDRHGSVLHANSAAGRLLGRPPGRLAGRPFALSVVQGSRRIFRGHLSAALRGGPVTASLPLQNGRLHTLTMWRDGDDVALLAAEGAETVPAAPAKAPPEEPAEEPADGTRYRGTAAEAALRETARQLTGTLADCVIIDIADRDRPFRVVALLRSPADGPGGVGISELCDPQPWSLTQQIMSSGESLAESPIMDGHGLSGVTGPLGTGWDAAGGSLLGVPLHRDGAVCGAIALVRGRTRPAFEQLDRMRLADLSDYLGFLIADLLRERHTTAAIETMRASLLPSALPKIPGVELSTCYQPAARDVGIGGDFYDLFTDGDCSWWVVVGDVCGKDDEAVSVTAMTRYGLRALSLDQASPAALLGRLNETMIRHDDSERFATAIVARLQPSDARLSVRLGSSGHPPAALLRADGSVGFCAGGGVPLGLFREAVQAEEQLWLSSGDCLLLYSDGVIEARDGTGRLFGEEGLALALRECDGSSAAAVVRSVRQAVAAFHGDRPLEDDMVVLAIRAK